MPPEKIVIHQMGKIKVGELSIGGYDINLDNVKSDAQQQAFDLLVEADVLQHHRMRSIEYGQVVLKRSSVTQLCYASIADFHCRYGHSPQTILMGNEQLWQLEDEFHLQSHGLMETSSSGIPRILNIDIVLVPHMDGVLALKGTYNS